MHFAIGAVCSGGTRNSLSGRVATWKGAKWKFSVSVIKDGMRMVDDHQRCAIEVKGFFVRRLSLQNRPKVKQMEKCSIKGEDMELFHFHK